MPLTPPAGKGEPPGHRRFPSRPDRRSRMVDLRVSVPEHQCEDAPGVFPQLALLSERLGVSQRAPRSAGSAGDVEYSGTALARIEARRIGFALRSTDGR